MKASVAALPSDDGLLVEASFAIEQTAGSAPLDVIDVAQIQLDNLQRKQPEDVRRATLAEALRVTRPGGKRVIVDYHGPRRFKPVRYFMMAVLRTLEPFAKELWQNEIADYLPGQARALAMSKRTCFADLYQIVCIET